MKLALLYVVSWLFGFAAYLASTAIFFRQRLSSGDLKAVAFWSAIAFAFAFGVLYLPALFLLRKFLNGVRPGWVFPLASSLLGIAPTAFILSIWGGFSVRAPTSPEATLFYCMFGVTGLVAGSGFVLIHRNSNST